MLGRVPRHNLAVEMHVRLDGHRSRGGRWRRNSAAAVPEMITQRSAVYPCESLRSAAFGCHVRLLHRAEMRGAGMAARTRAPIVVNLSMKAHAGPFGVRIS